MNALIAQATPELKQALSSWVNHGIYLGIILIVAGAALWLTAWLSRQTRELLTRGKSDPERVKLAATVSEALRWTLTAAIAVAAVLAALANLGFVTPAIRVPVEVWLITKGPLIVLTLVLTGVALRVSNFLALRLVAFLQRNGHDIESQKRLQTLDSVVRWLLRTGILVTAAMQLLTQMGVPIGPILATAGVVGLAVGFGAQNLVQDIISGFFILLEDQVRVGDVVQLNDKAGLVERVTLRMTTLRDLSGSVHYVRNGKIDVVTNMTKEYSFAVFDIGVAYRENVDDVIRVMSEVGKALQEDPAFQRDILAPLEVFGLDKFADSAVVIKARVKTRPIQQWRIAREYNRRLKQRFDELGIEIPFPHITLYPGKDKQGQSPSLTVEVAGNLPGPTA